jgi:hypothetical protein
LGEHITSNENQETDFPLKQFGISNDQEEEQVLPLILNELGEYNLFLLRNIYDAFEGPKGDKIVSVFREHDFTGLRPKALVIPPEVMRQQQQLMNALMKKRMQNKDNDMSVYLDAKQKSMLEMTGESEAHFVSFLNTHDSDKLEMQFRDRLQLNEYGECQEGEYDPRRRTGMNLMAGAD